MCINLTVYYGFKLYKIVCKLFMTIYEFIYVYKLIDVIGIKIT